MGSLMYDRLLADELQDDPPHTRLFTVPVVVCVTVPVVVALCVAG
ncbi:hypothetical protein [Streptomyces sp. NPDC050988]